MNEQLYLCETVSPRTLIRMLTGVNEEGDSILYKKGTLPRPFVHIMYRKATESIVILRHILSALLPEKPPVDFWTYPGGGFQEHLLRIIYSAMNYETQFQDTIYIHDNQLEVTHANIIRCIVGDPWRIPYCQCDDSVGFVCDWCSERSRLLQWNNGTIRKLLTNISRDKDFSILPILADALEEAGFGNIDMIQHCRGYIRCYNCLGLGSAQKTVKDYRELLNVNEKVFKTKVVSVPCPERTHEYVRPNITDVNTTNGPSLLEHLENADVTFTKYFKCNNGWRRIHTPHVEGCHVVETLLGRR